jgi:hypothetical protein
MLICCAGIMNVALAQEDSIKSESKNDTTRIVLGKKEIKIIDSEAGTDIKVREKENTKDQDFSTEKDNSKHKDGKKKNRAGGFRGHLDGVEIGFNGFLDKKHSMSLKGDDSFMSLNTNPTKSTNISVNFGQVSQGIFGNAFGMVTGLRFDINNYFFDNNNTIEKDINGVIVPHYFYNDDSTTIRLDKSKLSIFYFTIPILFELQLPSSRTFHKRFWLSGGILGSLKIDSHTKVVYNDNGKRKRDKNRDDFNIAVLRYGFTGRVGYSNFFAYANYFPVQFFEKDKGPELYPFAVGVGLHFN